MLLQLNNARNIPRTSSHYGSWEIRSDWKKRKEIFVLQRETFIHRGACKGITGSLSWSWPSSANRGTMWKVQVTSFTPGITSPSSPTDSNYRPACWCTAMWQRTGLSPLLWTEGKYFFLVLMAAALLCTLLWCPYYSCSSQEVNISAVPWISAKYLVQPLVAIHEYTAAKSFPFWHYEATAKENRLLS